MGTTYCCSAVNQRYKSPALTEFYIGVCVHVCVGAGFGGLARSTVLDMFSLRYLLDIQVKVLSQKLIICVLSSEERL